MRIWLHDLIFQVNVVKAGKLFVGDDPSCSICERSKLLYIQSLKILKWFATIVSLATRLAFLVRKLGPCQRAHLKKFVFPRHRQYLTCSLYHTRLCPENRRQFRASFHQVLVSDDQREVNATRVLFLNVYVSLKLAKRLNVLS